MRLARPVRICALILLVCLLVMGAGAAYNALSLRHFRQIAGVPVLMTLEWYRLRGDCTSIPSGFEAYGAWIKADSCVPSRMDAIERELDAE